jgi:hypothetical protein
MPERDPVARLMHALDRGEDVTIPLTVTLSFPSGLASWTPTPAGYHWSILRRDDASVHLCLRPDTPAIPAESLPTGGP